jgi:hypothetical protein
MVRLEVVNSFEHTRAATEKAERHVPKNGGTCRAKVLVAAF